MSKLKLCALAVAVLLLLAGGCAKNEGPRGLPELLLAQAQFTKTGGGSQPGAAKLLLYYRSSSSWVAETLEDPESNVFHKALYFQPANGDSAGILTIGGNAACLKLWHRSGSGWEAQTLWKTSFGGKQNRLRDMEIADVNGDGVPEIIIATHDQGVVAVVQQKGAGYVPLEACREPNTFVHEIEVGDVDGDGLSEFFATPSAPNKLDGSIQPGKVVMFDYRDGKYDQRVVDDYPRLHVKEILCADVLGTGRPVLLASLESENAGGSLEPSDSTRIRLYRFDGGRISSEEVAALPGQLCRFLTSGDVDGDGKGDVIASTQNSGIWILKPRPGRWARTLIDDGSSSSGFEHATLIADLNGDGRNEIYVAADDQDSLNRYTWDGSRFAKERLATLKEDCITFNLNSIPHPAK
jgi:hypothetical protein